MAIQNIGNMAMSTNLKQTVNINGGAQQQKSRNIPIQSNSFKANTMQINNVYKQNPILTKTTNFAQENQFRDQVHGYNPNITQSMQSNI